MKKKLVLIGFIISIFSLIFIDNIKADINSYGVSQDALASGSCGGTDKNRACMSTEWYKNGKTYTALYGARVSLVDNNGETVSGTTTKNFWATQAMKTKVTSLNLANKLNYSNVYVNGTGLDIAGLRNIDSTNYTYARYLSGMTEDNVLAYLKELYGRTNITIQDAQSYYLKFEPIYVLQFVCDKRNSSNVGASCKNKIYYIAGTSYEILDFGFNGFSSNSSARSYFKYIALDKTLYTSWGGNFNDNSKGLWNVIKNYTLTTYIDKQISGTNFPYFNPNACGITIKKLKEDKKERIHQVNQLLLKNTCNARSILGVGYVTVNKYLSSCETRVSNNDTMDYRISLYNEYNHMGLLNLANTGKTACSAAPSLTSDVSCLSGGANIGEFTNTNLSQYDETIDVNGTTGYCLTSFNLTPSTPWQQGIEVISGRIVPNTDGVVAKGTLTKKCYVPGYSGNSINANLNYYEIVGDVLLGDTKLDIVDKPDPVTKFNYDSGLYVSTITVDYRFSPIYLEKITGIPHTSLCSNCQFLTYGLLSKFNERGKQELSFSFKFNGKKYPESGQTYCTYTATPEIIINNDKLNLEFRPFSSDNAFPGVSGNKRTKGSNWSIFNLDHNKDDLVNIDDLTSLNQSITNGEFVDLKYDINADFKVDQHDFDLIRKIINKYLNNGEDTYAEEMLSYRPNSYGYISATKQTGTTPKYVIELTPSDIKDIRDYNKETSYDDYNLVCDQNGNNCISSYLTELKNKGILTINNSSKR